MNNTTRPEPPDLGTGNAKLPEPNLDHRQQIQLKVEFSLSGFVAVAVSRKTWTALVAALALLFAGNPPAHASSFSTTLPARPVRCQNSGGPTLNFEL